MSTSANDKSHILRSENLKKIYGKRTVVKDASINVRQGEVVGLLGPNGAGKTTTFYMITGMIKPNGGSIFIDEGVLTVSIGTVAQIRIRDTGPGIPESVRGKIFQPFFTTKDEGTGLGLSIANRIIAEHRGLLHVDVIEGQGTAFVIQLPIEEVAA